MIKHFKFSNFKKFKEVELDLKQFTVLMGENGCGKTSILQALSLSLSLLSSTDLITYEKSNRQIRFRPKGVPFSQLPGFQVEDPFDLFYAKQARGGVGGGVTAMKFNIKDVLQNIYKISITSQFGAYVARIDSKKTDFPSPPMFIDSSPLFISGFVGITSSEERLFPIAIQDRLTRGRASEILRNLLLDTKINEPEKFDKLREKVKKHFSFELGEIKFLQDKDIYVHANYKEELENKDILLDLSSAGSGFLQCLQILTPIYRFSAKSKIVLLDEPDAHLHPNLQRTIAKVLQEISEEENLQIVLSTHSTAIIKEISPEFIVPVKNEENKLEFLNSNVDADVEILSRLDNYFTAKAKISGKILFVEDKNLKLLSKIDSLLNSKIVHGVNNVPIMSVSGKDDKIPFRIKDTIEKLANTDVKVYFLRDSDGIPENWKSDLVDYANSKEVDLHLIKYHEIESYLINPSLIQESVKKHFDIDLDKNEIELELITIMKDIISRSKYGFDLTLRDVLYKTARLINKNDYNYPDAEGEARRIRTDYEALSDFEQLKIVAPGKETIKEYLKELNNQHDFQLTQNKLTTNLIEDYIDTELKSYLKRMND